MTYERVLYFNHFRRLSGRLTLRELHENNGIYLSLFKKHCSDDTCLQILLIDGNHGKIFLRYRFKILI